MILEDILTRVDHRAVHGPRDLVVSGVTNDSRLVAPGALFVAISGDQDDGMAYAGRAVEAGASAVLFDSASAPGLSLVGATRVIVDNARRALAQAADAFYGQPSAQLDVLGVTGTNGKTSVTSMARDILKAVGRRPGLIGTVNYETGRSSVPAVRTTPGADELQRLFAEMVQNGCDTAVLEVSSHALCQERVTNVRFDTVVFTNLTAEHLDYHHDMESYFEAKAQLFDGHRGDCNPSVAVVGIDDPWGRKLLGRIPAGMQVLSFGISEDADVRVERTVADRKGSQFICHTPWGTRDVTLNLAGRFNVLNAMAALGACGAMGADLDDMVTACAQLSPVPGRLQEVPNPGGAHIFVDYAHTHEALASVLGSLRELPHRSLRVLFGCGGDRDRAKRPLMGEVACKLADQVVVTTDNPRTEDPASIIDDIRAGMSGKGEVVFEPDRKKAIGQIVRDSGEGDIVLIAGKGHETYQDLGSTVVPFDDCEVVQDFLDAERNANRGL